MGSEVKVGDIMNRDVISIEASAPVTEVAKLMKKHEVGSVVVSKAKKAEGIITEKDIVYKVVIVGADASKVTAEKIMSKPLKVVTPETSVEEAAQAMKRYNLKRFPVVNDTNELVGMISEGDISRVLPSIIDLIEEKAEAGFQ
jgi:CBS domain-containing protein